MDSGSWFFPPDFHMPHDGPLVLGTVITDPRNPTRSIVSLPLGPGHPITLPEIHTQNEPAHVFCGKLATSSNFKLYDLFIDLALKFGIVNESNRKILIGPVDVECHIFKKDMTTEAIQSLVNIEEIKRYLGPNLGWLNYKAVYIISGVMISAAPCALSGEPNKSTKSVEVSGGVPGPSIISGKATLEFKNERELAHDHGIVTGTLLAFRCHIIRPSRCGPYAQIFASDSGMKTGSGRVANRYECVDATIEELQMAIEDFPTNHLTEPLGDVEAKGTITAFNTSD